jgi:Nse1 non-SMC component of SMC5-6 complex
VRANNQVNTTSDAFTQLATMHSPSEIAYMRALLVAIFDSANSVHEEVFAIRSSEAINLTSTPGVGLTKTAGEATIDAFIHDGWLVKSRAGFITVSERALMELRGYLLETFADDADGEEQQPRTTSIRTCRACQEIITKVTPYQKPKLNPRANVVQVSDVPSDSTIIAPVISSLPETLRVQPAGRPGKSTYSLVSKHAQRVVDVVCPVVNVNPSPPNLRGVPRPTLPDRPVNLSPRACPELPTRPGRKHSCRSTSSTANLRGRPAEEDIDMNNL